MLGLARSGVALCRFLADRGAIVTGYDARSADELGAALDQLEGRPVRLMLGPEVDPRAALAGQALVCTSPSVSSRYPTTEPRLRSALAELEADGARAGGQRGRPVPAPLPGDDHRRDRHQGQDDDLIADRGRPCRGAQARSSLGGNIGVPLVEQLPDLTPDHRVVLELSELQLPTISRGTDVAVYTHVSSDHLDRHGSLGAYRAVKRRLAELLPANGTLVLNAEDPVSSDFAEATKARVIFYRRSEPLPGGLGVCDDWIVDDRRRRIMPDRRAARFPGAHNAEQCARGGRRWAALRDRAGRHQARGRELPGRRASPRAGRVVRRRDLHQ